MLIAGLVNTSCYKFFGLFKGGILGDKIKAVGSYKIYLKDLPHSNVLQKYIKRK